MVIISTTATKDLLVFLKQEILEALDKGDFERADKLQRISDMLSGR